MGSALGGGFLSPRIQPHWTYMDGQALPASTGEQNTHINPALEGKTCTKAYPNQDLATATVLVMGEHSQACRTLPDVHQLWRHQMWVATATSTSHLLIMGWEDLRSSLLPSMN